MAEEGQGQSISGVLSTRATPHKAKAKRSSDQRVGRSSNSNHANNTDQAGMV